MEPNDYPRTRQVTVRSIDEVLAEVEEEVKDER